MDLKSTGDFDLRALAAALDEQRKARGLSWSGVAREMSGAKVHDKLKPLALLLKIHGLLEHR